MLNVAWAVHEITADHIGESLDFIENAADEGAVAGSSRSTRFVEHGARDLSELVAGAP